MGKVGSDGDTKECQRISRDRGNQGKKGALLRHILPNQSWNSSNSCWMIAKMQTADNCCVYAFSNI
jgi:hypothetical protein